MTRADAEKEIVGRVGAWLSQLGKSTVTDGTNPDLNSPIRRALASLGITVADPANVTDAEVGQVPADKVENFFDLVEFYAIDGLMGSVTGKVSQLGPRREDQTKILQPLTNRWRNLSNQTKPNRPDAPSLGEFQRTILPVAPVAVHAVWRATGARAAAAPATPTPKPPPKPDPEPKDPTQEVVIELTDETHNANYNEYLVCHAIGRPVGVILPPIEKGDDGKHIRLTLMASENDNWAIFATQDGAQIAGVLGEAAFTSTASACNRRGETVRITVDEDNKRWLVNHYALEGGGQRTLNRRVRLRAGEAQRITHNWGNRNVTCITRIADTQQEIRLVSICNLNDVTISSNVDQEYDVILEEH